MLKNSASGNRAQEREILRTGGLIEVLRRRLRPITGFGKRVDLPEGDQRGAESGEYNEGGYT